MTDPVEQAPPPIEPELDPEDPRTRLQERLRSAILALPGLFEFDNVISGVNATDLFNLNTLLGASIEGQFVRALNGQRGLWDPDDEWLGYAFERQSQAFPDVRLVRKSGNGGEPDIALGIELKGWFALSKEGEPSFRFATSPAACAPHDLLVVVPWYLDNVLSGNPVAIEPYVVSARWAAEYRNYYWQVARRVAAGTNTDITAPPDAHPYPKKNELTSDVPAVDGGGNFGRVSRTPGLMDSWVAATNDFEALGIRLDDWRRFLALHTDKADLDEVSAALESDLRKHAKGVSAAAAEKAAHLVEQLVDLLR